MFRLLEMRCLPWATTLIVILSDAGRSAQLVAKYKPGMPIFVCSKYPHVAKQSRTLFGTHGVYNPSNITKVRRSSFDLAACTCKYHAQSDVYLPVCF